jgi:Zn-dependent protease/predicted transcriptional regulator
MKGSIYLGNIACIRVKIHLSFFLIFLLVAYQGYQADLDLRQIFQECVMVSVLFFCVLLHEFGHAFTARRYGIQTDQIFLLPIGGVAQLNRMPEKPMQELAVALGGPMVNVAIAIFLLPVIYFNHELGTFLSMFSMPASDVGSFAVQLCYYNIILLVFNMIPAFPMDGGRVLRALLGLRLNFLRSTQIATRTGQIISLVFIFLGFRYGQYALSLIGIFVLAGGEFEYRLVKRKFKIGGLKVRDAMMNYYNIVHPLDNLQKIQENVSTDITGKDYLVVEDNRVTGILTREALENALADPEFGPSAFAGTVMKTDYPVVDVDETLDTAMEQMQESELNILPVYENNRWIGSGDSDHITQLIMRG